MDTDIYTADFELIVNRKTPAQKVLELEDRVKSLNASVRNLKTELWDAENEIIDLKILVKQQEDELRLLRQQRNK